MNIENLKGAISDIQKSRMISDEVVMSAIKDGLVKAASKHIEGLEEYKLSKEQLGERKENKTKREIQVRFEVDEAGEIKLYHQRTVTDQEVTDPAIDISLKDAVKTYNKDVQVGDVVEDEVKIENFSRSSVMLMKNVMNQQIKEANIAMVYDEYIDRVDDIVLGTIQTVEEKFALIELDKTIALLPKSEQIPNEKYYDGQKIKVVIKSVSKDSKAAQVVVSRSSPNLVKRLFEETVTEIYDGTVEIKGIAREANERTKMAVSSNNSNVDPVAACIGPRGSRVNAVIDEITQKGNPNSHENIDIVEWNDNLVEYVKNVMRPAIVLGVLPADEEGKNLLVVVEDKQLSLAIGKKGVNARLAVKLLNRKIDIKAQSEVEANGIDWYNETLLFAAKQEAIRKQKVLDEMRLQQQQEEAIAEAVETLLSEEETVEEVAAPEEVVENVVEETVEAVVEETVVEEPVVEEVEEK